MNTDIITFIVNGLKVDNEEKFSRLSRCMKHLYNQSSNKVKCLVYLSNNEYFERLNNQFCDATILVMPTAKSVTNDINCRINSINSKYLMLLNYDDVCSSLVAEKLNELDCDVVVFGASFLGKDNKFHKIYDENALKKTENYLKTHLFAANLALKTSFLAQKSIKFLGFSPERQTLFIDFCFSLADKIQFVKSVELYVPKLKLAEKFSYDFFYSYRNLIRNTLKNFSKKKNINIKKFIAKKYLKCIFEEISNENNLIRKIKLRLIYIMYFYL